MNKQQKANVNEHIKKLVTGDRTKVNNNEPLNFDYQFFKGLNLWFKMPFYVENSLAVSFVYLSEY